MKFTLDDDTTLPGKFEVCPTCDGKGTRVNPSIDGFTRDDLDEWFGSDADDFLDDYMSGTYDVQCSECKGQRVVLVPDKELCTPEQWEAYEAHMRDEYEYESIRMAEIRAGC